MKKIMLVLSIALVFIFGVVVTAASAQAAQAPERAVEVEVTPETLLVFAAAALAFGFDYMPGLKTWYEKLDEIGKRQLMLGLLVLTAAVIFAGQCFGIILAGLACDLKSAFDLLYMIFLAIGVNQGVHFLTKPSARAKAKG